ncbi:MAG: hypothetical protein HRT40_04575 [Campylobacteraceae bacterium]|nr:hypothetical protein [Campylobacteraceae bacterium]
MSKKIITTSLALLVLLSGCGDNGAEKEFRISQNLDKGNYQEVINELGDCSSASSKSDCLLQLGSAYFGKAGFDTISLGQELAGIENDGKNLSDDDKSKKFTSIIFSKILNKNTEIGLEYFSQVLGNKKSYCSEAKYNSINDEAKKSACLSINPILLKDLLDDDKNNNKPKDTRTVSLQDVIKFKNVIQDAIPELTSDDLVAIVNGDSSSKVLLNKKLDATKCALKAFDTTPPTSCNILSTKMNIFTNSKYTGIHSVIVKVDETKYYREVKETTTPGKYTSITLDISKIVDSSVKTNTNKVDGEDNFYMPVLSKDGIVSTLSGSIESTLNNKESFKSIALLVNTDDKVDDSTKVKKLEDDFCKNGGCTGTSGNLEISQEAVLAYINK